MSLVKSTVCNDIGVLPAKCQIEICGSEMINYSLPSQHTYLPNMRRTQSFLLRNPSRTIVLPGEYVQFSTPPDFDLHTFWALELQIDYLSNLPHKPEDARPPPQ